MRLIDADALLNRMQKDPLFDLVERYGVSGVIEAEPTVDAVPVRHGKWILEQEEYDGYGYGNWNRWKCSCCGYIRTKGWATTSEGHKPKAMLCEKCGAKMDEERKEE